MKCCSLPILGLCLGLILLLAPTTIESQAPNPEIVPDVVYAHKFGMALTFDVFKPEQANGAGILFMVSGGWISRWYPPEQAAVRLQPFLDRGFTVFAVRHGSSPRFKVPEAVADVRISSARTLRTTAWIKIASAYMAAAPVAIYP